MTTYPATGVCSGGSCSYTAKVTACGSNTTCSGSGSSAACAVCKSAASCGDKCSACSGSTTKCKDLGTTSKCVACLSDADCSPNATCPNTEGSFTCRCKNGFSGDGVTCTNVDECADKIANCSLNAACVDTSGAYTCTCKPGYVGNGVICSPPPSCNGLAALCGSEQNDDCCASLPVAGGNFLRNNAANAPATVASFALDKYEVTVGRFRRFISAYGGPPADGAGAHPLIVGSGWQTAWNGSIASSAATLTTDVQCSANATWSSSTNDDRLPINCVSWFVAFAFCAWDGGRLPTEAEWEYAAAGGDSQLTYPWGSHPPDITYAVFDCEGDGSAALDCAFSDILPAGSKPFGAGKYLQRDLIGSVAEWTLDAYAAYPSSCVNCANLFSLGASPVTRGAAWNSNTNLTSGSRVAALSATSHGASIGMRCAR
jgi:formylglycine-generating enzyme